MRLTTFCILFPALTYAQRQPVDLKAEESAIRAIIAKGAPPSTDNAIRWSGATPRPAIAPDRGTPYPEAQVEKRKNTKQTVEVQRIEVAAAGDMAYEFSYGHLEYDVDVTPPRHASFGQGILRVWKKDHGEWETAAIFVRPLDEPYNRMPSSK